ncbi:hypothetical protein HPB50_001294 [Hyalomma asiaticum]|uniref:Uncharacterized protein n=1 Tax=Hyalomma asiaticum TaxID=266040 RepID=A0ACB7RLF1_HYAAI|nr:hypothetical protein HPB50_001294 [Hyalomma asiaticum]
MIVYKDDDYGNDEFDVQARADGESGTGSKGNSNGDISEGGSSNSGTTGDQANGPGATDDGNDYNADNTFPQDKRSTLMYADENGGGCSVFFIFPVDNIIKDVPWDQWKQAFGAYIMACGASELPGARRKATVLTHLSMEGQQIFTETNGLAVGLYYRSYSPLFE